MKKCIRNFVRFFIDFNEEVTNSVLYSSRYYRGTNPLCQNVQHLFELDGRFFSYSSHVSYNGSTEWLKEISADEFQREKVTCLSLYPWKDGAYDDGKTMYSLQVAEEAMFCRMLSPQDVQCSHPGIVAIMEDITADMEAEKKKQEEADYADRKAYAYSCSVVAKRLNMSFVNVIRLGYDDEAKLLAFQESLAAAKNKLAALNKEEREACLHEIFECGRARKLAALESLGVKTFGRDVNYMDFSELK